MGLLGFHNEVAKRRILVEKDKAVVNTLNRTKVEEHPDLAALQEERAARWRAQQRW